MKKISNIQIPVFVIHELIIRLQEIDPLVGEYKSHYFSTEDAVVETSYLQLRFPMYLLRKQFQDPELISQDELRQQLPFYLGA
ncbi:MULTISPECIES: hypothetical protein [Olivibacter]|jgi:hypothetical protein|uniref:Transcriptional regulator, TetR family n=3 Tax=Sphingobacteriaceae TaxID=84566 RepID=F4CFK5_SPHS2|nr:MULTISPECIES: hypothetical protein [Olivibacter]MCL4638709.1 hypothetical protein [Olivibacter sp. UJ_SKK_5.1]MDM8176392.1 hypothetical protein [Olivibacter sp. 47]MDX3916570.1 hypothetical protein [Pseudosphingobacterium sp.]QEL01203.1 hypothetical protein FKG96_10405 [Olivibacter sp. LS-1]